MEKRRCRRCLYWFAAPADSHPLRRARRAAGVRCLHVKQHPARIGRNPRTQKTVQVDEKTVPYFKAGREMLHRLNGGSRPASEHPT